MVFFWSYSKQKSIFLIEIFKKANFKKLCLQTFLKNTTVQLVKCLLNQGYLPNETKTRDDLWLDPIHF